MGGQPVDGHFYHNGQKQEGRKKAKIRWDILLKISAKTSQEGNNYQDEINAIPHATKVMEIVQLEKPEIEKGPVD